MSASRELEVRPLRTRRERRTFLTLPWRIYREDPLWVPPLLPERAQEIDPRRGPFFRRGEAAFWIAWRGGEPLGTICAAEDKTYNELGHSRECLFGFFECVPDYAVAEAMLDCASDWARARGLAALLGPFNLARESNYGVLVEGRDRPPALLCGHTPPYYQDLLERYGFQPARPDNLAYAVDLRADTPNMRRLARVADRLRARGRYVVRQADLDDWEAEIDRVHALINRALAHLQDYVPWPRDELEAMLLPFRHMADPELVLFAEASGRTVGFLPGLPNLYQALQRANGMRYPWNALQLWWAMRRQPACLSIKSVLVLPEHWGTGVGVLLFDEMRTRAQAKGFQWVDLSLTSEDNPYTTAFATHLGAVLYKRYRVYRLPLAKAK